MPPDAFVKVEVVVKEEEATERAPNFSESAGRAFHTREG